MGRPAKDYTGNRINKLTVIKKLESRKVHGKIQPVWLCKCDCGVEKEIPAGLLHKNPLSCGCIRSELSREDLAGKVFNYLTVKSFSHSSGGAFWNCVCKCGSNVVAKAGDLRRGNTTSCGCLARLKQSITNTKQEINNVYGELTIVKQLETRGRDMYWQCRCSCGNTTEVRGSHLRNGGVKSCGCKAVEWQVEKKTTHGMSGTSKYANYQRRERKRKEAITGDWSFEKEQFLRNLFQQCVVCGITENEHQEKHNQSLHLDHIRPIKYGNGLSVENSTILCADCNRFKHAKQLEDLPRHVASRIKQSSELFQLLWESKENEFCIA